jgi:hypothetical protein
MSGSGAATGMEAMVRNIKQIRKAGVMMKIGCFVEVVITTTNSIAKTRDVSKAKQQVGFIESDSGLRCDLIR